MIKLLWIDDNLDHDLAEFRMALRMNGELAPDFARNASEAYDRLLRKPYDVVIVDLRMPPGPDDMWNKEYDAGERKFGYILLKNIFENISNRFAHLKKTKFGVFSIELWEENPGLKEYPISLKKDNFKMKTETFDENDFIDFILKVYKS